MKKQISETEERGGATNRFEQYDAPNAPSCALENRNSPHRFERRPSRLFDALTASPQMSRAWRAAAGVCFIAALLCGWSGRVDATFIVAALGVVAWFLNLRGQFHRAVGDFDSVHESSEDETPPA